MNKKSKSFIAKGQFDANGKMVFGLWPAGNSVSETPATFAAPATFRVLQIQEIKRIILSVNPNDDEQLKAALDYLKISGYDTITTKGNNIIGEKIA